MPNTPKKKDSSKLIRKEKELILSLKKQPLIVLLRINNWDLENGARKEEFLILIDQLINYGVRHLEIAWSQNSQWGEIIKHIRNSYKDIILGAASVTTEIALDEVIRLKLPYAMTPFLDKKLQKKSKQFSQVLIPGVFSPSEIQKAISYGCGIIKLFPASTLGINYIEQIRLPIGHIPFIIAAGGLKVIDIDAWLKAGYGAITLGRNIIKGKSLDPTLKIWLAQYNSERR